MFCRRLARSRSMLALGFMMFAVGCSDSESDSAAGSAAQAGASGSAGTGGSAGTSGQSGTAGEGGAAGSAGSAGSSGAAGAGGTAGAALVFGTCQEGYQTECASFQAPLNHDATGGETIDIHISRIPATSTANRQIWLLSGGPGQGGYVYHDFAAQISGLIPDADVYVIDHRGTGYSHRLTCPQQDTADSYGGYVLQVEDVPACLDALKTNGDYDRLPYFTTKQAAKDLELAISLTRAPEQKVFVWGGSYGTHWAHRFMQVAPTVAEGIIFDGFMTPNHFAFTHYDQGVEEAVSHFSDDCKADPVCVAKMGNDPFSHAKSVMDGLGSTPCGQFARSNARTWGSIFMDGFYSHAFVFPYVHRLERCNAEDKTALVTMVQNYYAALTAGGPQPYLSSGILQYNIVLTELWKLPGEAEPSAQSLDDAADQQVFLSGASYPAGLVSLRTLWPLPPDDYSQLPVPVSSSSSMLWLAGTLDTRTPLTQAQAVQSLYSGPKQHFVTIPGAVHTPSMGSPLKSDPTRTCGVSVVAHFISHDGEIDTSCFDDLYPTLFASPNEAFAQKWWGVSDDWGDGSTAQLARSFASAGAEPSLTPSLMSLNPMTALAIQRLRREGFFDH